MIAVGWLRGHPVPAWSRNVRRVLVGPDLAFSNAVSFATSTKWQAYGGETTLSYFSQMVGLTTAKRD